MQGGGGGGGWVSGWSERGRVGVRMEQEEVGGCRDGAGGGRWVSPPEYMAACDIGCRTASVEFRSAASLLDANELIVLSCRAQCLAVWSLTECLLAESPDYQRFINERM